MIYGLANTTTGERVWVKAMLNDPAIVYTTAPQNVMKYVDFMFKIGAIKTRPESWKDLFFPEIHALPGS